MTRLDLAEYALFPEPPADGGDFSIVHLLPREGLHVLSSACWCKPAELEQDDPAAFFGEHVGVWLHRAFAPRWG